jgi:RimK family alpha-L-glutamate ligase
VELARVRVREEAPVAAERTRGGASPAGDAQRVAVLARAPGKTNGELVAAWRRLGLEAELLLPEDAAARLSPGDVALVRLDVLPTLDGVEPGLAELPELERRGVRVLNSARGLLGAHDKLLTARLLNRAGIPHPRSVHLRRGERLAGLEPPVVVKPRFGSWGRDVFLCRTRADLERRLREAEELPWFRRHGALVQELVPPRFHDLRVVVAGGKVVGAAARVAAAGEWRTNVSLGGSLRRVKPSPAACELAVAAAAAIGADLVGVDLLPAPGDGYVVLELNGAVDFDHRYSLSRAGVFADVAHALGLVSRATRLEAPGTR